MIYFDKLLDLKPIKRMMEFLDKGLIPEKISIYPTLISQKTKNCIGWQIETIQNL